MKEVGGKKNLIKITDRSLGSLSKSREYIIPQLYPLFSVKSEFSLLAIPPKELVAKNEQGRVEVELLRSIFPKSCFLLHKEIIQTARLQKSAR